MLDIKKIRIPTQPGCYLYKDASGRIIYIGKAKNIKKRVMSYFSKEHEDVKTRLLVRDIAFVDFFVTKTEVEAFLLESSMIKKHRPKYNIELKDSKRYAYIVVTDEKFPRILVGRHKGIAGDYFGPFTSAHLRNSLVRSLRKIFFVRTCKKLPKKACLRYHIGLCKAPCVGYQSEEEYLANIEKAKRFLKGRDKELLRDIKKKMHEHARKQEFEQAQSCKEQIEALSLLHERQLVESESGKHEDAVNFVVVGNKVHVGVFSVRLGTLQDKEEFTFPYSEGFLEEFMKRYYEVQNQFIPQRIVLPRALEDPSIQRYLERQAGHKVELYVPKRGSRVDLLELVKKNLEISYDDVELLRDEMAKKLGVQGTVVECFDISHFQGSYVVGGMVRFVNGKPNKKNYRKFKIKTVDGVDDFRAIAEVVKRRYSRLLQESDKENFVGFPDLIVVDGGREQLRFALETLHDLRLDIPAIGLAKKFEEVYFARRKYPVRFDKKSRVMRMLMAARDEAHRFAQAYHKLLRKKGTLQ